MQPKDFFIRYTEFFVVWLALAVGVPRAAAQQFPTTSAAADRGLAQSVQELREQVQELRSAVAEMKSEAAQYRAQSAELRKELESMRARPVNAPSEEGNTSRVAPAIPGATASSGAIDQRVASLEETTQLLENEVRGQYQTKVESASKYRVRLSGLVLLNLFHNRGLVDNLDFPTSTLPDDNIGPHNAFGGTLRQSELGLEVFGPELAGAKTTGEVQFDFGGGFPTAALNGINTGLVRLRTANLRLDWEHNSVVVGQDSLFISPDSSTSFASLAVPTFGYSGNLWAWTPQLRVEHKFDLATGQNIILQAGILDNLSGEPSYGSHRLPLAGESSGQPAYALRTGWNRTLNGRPLTLGVSGYYSRQDWGFLRSVDGWAATTDWRIPLASRLELSGGFYRGRAVGGIAGGIGQSVLFSGDPSNPASIFRPVNSAGGWSQIKFSATPKLEFNGAVGIDDPFAADVQAFPSAVGFYPWPLTANRSSLANFIYHPRSDLLLSGEYRRLRTSQLGTFYGVDQVNLMMGVLF